MHTCTSNTDSIMATNCQLTNTECIQEKSFLYFSNNVIGVVVMLW